MKHLVFLFCSGGEKFYGWFIAVFHAWHSLEQRKLTIPPVTFSIQSSNNDTLENTPGLFLWHRFSIPLGKHFQRSHKIGNVDGVESLKIVVSLGKVKTTWDTYTNPQPMPKLTTPSSIGFFFFGS